MGQKQGNSVPGLLLTYITALVILATTLVNFITTLSIAAGSVVIVITSCVMKGEAIINAEGLLSAHRHLRF